MAERKKQAHLVTNLAGFVREMGRLVEPWKQEAEFDPWFRGQGDEAWDLIPSLYRPPNLGNLDEDDFISDFKRRAWPYLARVAHEPTTDWEWYFIMQHHGLPTRLLDWSESALVALYFALRDSPEGSDPAVWILDPWALNKHVAKKGDVILSPGEQKTQAYVPRPFTKRRPPAAPIAIEPPLKSLRITAQKGVFTMHGSSTKAINKLVPLRGRLARIVISGKCKDKVEKELAVAGITETTVFPELPALCKELLEYWRAVE